MNVGSLCTHRAFTIDSTADAVQAARRMRELHVGFLVVVAQQNGRETPVGVITDRDLVMEIVAQDVNPHSVAVQDIMTSNPLIVREQQPLNDALLQMRAAGVRRVPVLDSVGRLMGVLSLDDVVGFLNQMVQDLAGAISHEQSEEQRLRA